MGVGSSRFGSEGHSRLLDRFAGTVSIAIDDLFWEDLLTFPTQLTTFDPALVQEELSPTCHSLGKNLFPFPTIHLPALLLLSSHLLGGLFPPLSARSTPSLPSPPDPPYPPSSAQPTNRLITQQYTQPYTTTLGKDLPIQKTSGKWWTSGTGY
jgi:hypothetical protein